MVSAILLWCSFNWELVILLIIFLSYLKQDFSHFYWLELSSKRIDLKSLLGVYVVLGAGLLLAFLTLIAEVLFKRKRKQKVISRDLNTFESIKRAWRKKHFYQEAFISFWVILA